MPCFICYSAVNHSNSPGRGGRDWETGDIGSESCRLFLVVVFEVEIVGNEKDSGRSKATLGLLNCCIFLLFDMINILFGINGSNVFEKPEVILSCLHLQYFITLPCYKFS